MHHKLKWTNCFQAMNIHRLMMIEWILKKFNDLHPQSLGTNIQVNAYETTWWVYTYLYEMVCTWGILCKLTMGFGMKLQKYEDLSIRDHEKNNDHKYAMVIWEVYHFSPTILFSITHHVRASNAWHKCLLIYMFSKHHSSHGEVCVTM